MLNTISTYLQFGNYFCGIEHTTKNSKDIIVASLIKKSKKEIDIERVIEGFTIEEVTQKLPKKQHAVLILNDNNVLSKSIESEQSDNLKLVYKAFPNINIDDFYFEILHQNKTCFISLCRKQYVDDLIQSYREKGVSILKFSLGNTLISTVLEFVDLGHINTSNAIISINNNQIQHIEKTKSSELIHYDINGIQTSNSEVLSLSGALQIVLQANNSQTNFEKKKQTLFNHYKQTHFFSQFLKSGLVFILGLLLINYLIFSHYFNSVNELTELSEVNQGTKSTFLNLNTIVSKKQKRVDDLLKSNASKSSFYLNTIIQDLPNSILLSEFNYQPIKKRIKKGVPIEVTFNSITVSGTSSNSDIFSKWIAEIEEFNWTHNVSIIHYGSTSNTTSDFTIKIIITDDK